MANDSLSNGYPRSPLRYPGGKSRAVPCILPLIPNGETVLCSPFIGGASIELACTARAIEVRGYDLFQPLVDFWECLLTDADALADRVQRYLPMEKALFYELQHRYVTLDDKLERAAVFFALNRSSFSGTTLSGGMSPHHPRFTPSAIERLRLFRAAGFRVKQGDFRQTIVDNEDAFLYLDPPYLNGQKLYGLRGDTHSGFDHRALKRLLDDRGRWILSYNDCPDIRDLYADYRIRALDWRYGMSNDKRSREIVVLSHDVAA